MSNTVRQDRFINLHSEHAPVLSRWSYRADEPYSVTVAFQVSSENWIDWVFARDLVIAGLQGPSGIGDVRFIPFDDKSERLLLMQVESDQGRASWFLNRDELDEFVEMTYDAVPAGAESEFFDIDGLIDALTDV